MEKTEDRRIRKTKKQIRLGLAKMLMVKDYKTITVKELVEAADINRSTFYLHYRNVEVLMQTVEEEVLADVKKIFSSESDFIPIRSTSIIQKLFHYISENQEIVQAFLGPNGQKPFLDDLYQTILTEYHQALKANSVNTNSDDFELAFSFCFNGTVGIIKEWLAQPLPSRTMDHFTKLVSDIVIPTLDGFITHR